MDIRPDYANIEQNGKLDTGGPGGSVHWADVIVIKAGERIPLDGVVLEGTSTVDTAALTGESLPRDVEPGRRCNQRLYQPEWIAARKGYKGIWRIHGGKDFRFGGKRQQPKRQKRKTLLRNLPATTRRALSLALYYWRLVPPLIVGGWTMWIQRALIFLVISCPCALVISVPLSFFGGIGGASKVWYPGKRWKLPGSAGKNSRLWCLIKRAR